MIFIPCLRGRVATAGGIVIGRNGSSLRRNADAHIHQRVDLVGTYMEILPISACA
jgi:hypothetical protein